MAAPEPDGHIAESGEKTEQYFAMEPQDQVAIEGTKVTLPCRVENKKGTLQWTKDDFGLGPDRSLSGFDRYTMVGSDEEGDFSLQIDPVSLEDDARYQCQVSPGPGGEPGVRSRFAQLTVLVPPLAPRIVQGDHLETTEDREIELECESVGGKPPAEITWIDGYGNVLRGEDLVSEAPDTRKLTARSVLKVTPKKHHHNTTFTCQAQNQADRTYRSARLLLLVKYAPNVTVSVKETTPSSASLRHIPEGSDVRLACHADANPPEVRYKWFLDGEPVALTEGSTELVLRNVSRRHHDAIVKCQVENKVGKSEGSETLDVTYGPKFRQRPANVQADLDSMVTLTCDVDGNPTPEITWIHEDKDRVVGSSPNLTFKVEAERAGRYYCRATVHGYPEIGAEAAVLVKGPPKVLSPHTQWGHVGDNGRVECIVQSVPRPRIVWSYAGQNISSYDSDFSILDDPLPDGLKSTLIVRESQQQHYGVYNCTASNEYGAVTALIQLRAQKSYPLIIILTGVIGGVVVIIAITMVVILCQRRVNKPPALDSHEAEKQCRESDRSSNISDLKLELRTGSSVSRPGSETGSERGVGGVPLAGPVHLPMPMTLNGGDHVYRYSTEYPEPSFPPKAKDGQNNNGYVPYVDYSRDYTPPPSLSLLPPLSSMEAAHLGIPSSPLGALGPLACVDPRYSAAYGNPYLRSSSASLLPPHTSPAPSPPPYSTAVRGMNGAAPQVARLPNSPTSQYIVPSSQMATIKRGTLATHV
ncbi:hypothetical protein ONE63_002782 [Megalurothrips usitatus]|uniref:Ig-like domain-containing protein n=1 Tax=Megalurothrips usitatus TaxID=439358 RepID=A0AAV7XBW8_9NEOP|nr:hypothetical protein ONE63_002782 [Megalurothrips usitatus]